jgi:D-alanyl-lipoteichoic acid acyltransferase DltB (MBOAT superfamily)
MISSGCVLILIGYLRKVAIADGVAQTVYDTFARSNTAAWLDLLVGLYLFAIQLYCDFAGYSDIARGVSRLFGIELMENFRHPYFSTNIAEFWNRWHISLSTWLRDYVYYPMALIWARRWGKNANYMSMFFSMFLIGLWHGASWLWVVFGCIHGALLIGYRLILRGKMQSPPLKSQPIRAWPLGLLRMAVTFHVVLLSLVLVRAYGVGNAWNYVSRILSFSDGVGLGGVKLLCVSVGILMLVDIPQYLTDDHTAFQKWPKALRGVVYATFVLAIMAMRTDGTIPFIYFQF